MQRQPFWLCCQAPVALFSSAAASDGDASGQAARHKEEHMHATTHHKFFENDFISTSIKELEFVRSPFYDLGRAEHAKEGEDAQEFITNIQLKIGMT